MKATQVTSPDAIRSTPRSRSQGSRQRDGLIARFQSVRAFTEELCAPLEIEDYVIQSMPDASPAKWHLAHTTWFFETFVLRPSLPADEPVIDPAYSYLFNSYYNAVGPMHCRPRRGMISRPTVEEVRDYRRQIDERMLALMTQASEAHWRELEPTIVLGLNHEQQHQELLLTDLKHMLAQNPLYPVYRERPETDAEFSPAFDWVGFPEGIHWIGHAGGGFAFDNEGPRHKELVGAFQLGSRLVTNGEYLLFMEDGGYERPEFWLSLGWMSVNENRWRSPLYWEKRNDRWFSFTLGGLQPIEEAEPVCHVSYFEADAYARWAGARLPTEAEWEVAAEGVPVTGNFAESGACHPVPVESHPAPGTLAEMYGDVWEWTRSSYSPYPGFQPAAGAVGEYNGKFMCNQYVLRGGSCATAQAHIRRTYRNFFPPDKRWQFTGIRLAQDIR